MSQMPPDPRLEEAKARTDQVQRELEVASAELGLTQNALERELPPEIKQGDVGWAIQQNADIERRVHEAAEELEQVSELLERVRRRG